MDAPPRGRGESFWTLKEYVELLWGGAVADGSLAKIAAKYRAATIFQTKDS